jgi:hypothetical protein
MRVTVLFYVRFYPCILKRDEIHSSLSVRREPSSSCVENSRTCGSRMRSCAATGWERNKRVWNLCTIYFYDDDDFEASNISIKACRNCILCTVSDGLNTCA